MPSRQPPQPPLSNSRPRGGASWIGAWVLLVAIAGPRSGVAGDGAPSPDTEAPPRLIGFTTLQTNLPGGRHANVQTMRATVIAADGSGRHTIGAELVDGPDVWTQFGGWSPDGRQAIVGRGWQDPANAKWEEEHKDFRMVPGGWLVDCCLVGLDAGATPVNLTAVGRVSH